MGRSRSIFRLERVLISGLLFREYHRTADLDIPRFLVRRAFKIYPGFWVLILVTCIVALFFNIGFYRRGLLGELLFVQNYFASLWEHTWSLAVEEHFYFGLCILFYFLLYRRKTPSGTPFGRIPHIFAIIAVACFALRLLTETLLPFQYERNIEPTHLRIDSLFFGVFLSYLWHSKTYRKANS